MAMPAYAKYTKITGERKYLDYAMNSYKWSRDTLANGLFNKKEGLWWRDKNYVPPYKEKDGSNCYWSRGNGWVYAALVRVMETLPKTDKYYQYLKKDLSKVKENLDHQMSTKRVNYWTWIDAIQMAMPAYAKYAKITGERKYLDYAMNSYKWSRDTLANGLFNKKEGLWWRDKDYVPPYKEKDGSNCYWSRGNGWVYAALVRVMETLPKKDKYYQYLKKDFILMSKAILKCQREDGYWNVSLVCPANYGGPEMTGTGLFLYGMAWGVQQGILPRATYQKAMDKAWKALAASVHEDGFIGYNQGTGKDPAAGQPVTFTSVPDFEDYGTGCLLLGAAEYYKLLNVKK